MKAYVQLALAKATESCGERHTAHANAASTSAPSSVSTPRLHRPRQIHNRATITPEAMLDG